MTDPLAFADHPAPHPTVAPRRARTLEPPPDPPFGAILKEHRFVLGLTQQALAAAVHVSRSLIKEIERGRVRPSRDLAVALAAYLALDGPERATFLCCARASLPPAPGAAPGAPRGRPPGATTLAPDPAGPADAVPLVLCLLLPADLAPLVDQLHSAGGSVGPLPAGPVGGPIVRVASPVEDVPLILVSLMVLRDPALLLPAIADVLRTAR